MVDTRSTYDGRRPLATGAILAVALALILAAHEVGRMPSWSLIGVYAYWATRIGMAYLIIVGAYAVLAQVMTGRSSPIAHAGLAAALSFPPFVMATTTLNLIIGNTELLQIEPDVLIAELGIEAASLIDNHLTTSALLLAPYVLYAMRPAPRGAQTGLDVAGPVIGAAAPSEPDVVVAPIEAPGLLLASQPPVLGDLIAAEAQEHYVKLKATEQGGMALYRFGDAVRDLARYNGMQVHRSHWVSDAAVLAVIGKRGAMKLELSDGEVIPVSRRYELEVEARFSDRERRAE